MPVNGLGVAYATTGIILFWSGFTGNTVKDTLTGFLKGTVPPKQSLAPPSIGVNNSGSSSGAGSTSSSFATPAGSGSSSNGQAALKQAAHAYGWDTGNEWTALNNVEMAEAGYNPTARNPSSGALGLAQALGHGGSGTAGSLGNEYGGFGLSASEAQQANSGNAYWQAVWMVNYIKSRWGDPIKAWQNEQANHWY